MSQTIGSTFLHLELKDSTLVVAVVDIELVVERCMLLGLEGDERLERGSPGCVRVGRENCTDIDGVGENDAAQIEAADYDHENTHVVVSDSNLVVHIH